MRLSEIIKLSDSNIPENFRDFMKEVRAETYPNPINGRENVWQDKACLEFTVKPDSITLDTLRTFEKGKGYAHEALNWVTHLADEYNVPLYLFAVPMSQFKGKKIPKIALKNLYSKHGFVTDKNQIDSMIRIPKGSK